ncbi:MAG: ABC transporter substrate-binding protein [Clostridia bacterium]|nr:ABC transporter substrate-binding protein [Clostridia bacterium]
MKRWIILLTALMLLCSCVACAPTVEEPESSLPESSIEDNPEYPVTVVGVTFEHAPLRAVALTPALAEAVSELGYGEALCGVTDTCEALELEGVTELGDLYALNYDRLAALMPDLILTQSVPDTLATWAEKAGVPVLVLTPPTDADSLRAYYKDLAAVFGGKRSSEAAATTLYLAVTGSLQLLSGKVPVEGEAPKVLYLADASGAVATGDTVWQWLLDTLSAKNVAAAGVNWAAPADMETPDTVFCPAALTAQAKKVWPKADIVVLSKDAAYYSGHTLNTIAFELAEALYPAAMEDISAEVSENSEE